MQQSLKRVVKGTFHFSSATFFSRILGFLRDIVIASTLGASPLADSFFVAFRIPNLLRRLFAEGSLTMAFVPIFVSIKEKNGVEDAFCFSRSVFIWLFIILGVITGCVILFAKYICIIVAPGFYSSNLLNFTATLLRICFPYIFFISGVAMCMGILNSMNHFFVPAFSPCILNICLILSAITGWYIKASIPIFLSFGVLIAGILQFLIQQPVLFKYGFHWKGKIKLFDKRLKELLNMMGPSIFGAAVYQITILINTILASFLPRGSISYLYYADRFVQFPLGVFGVALGMASLPNLSELAVKRKWQEYTDVLNKSLYLNLFISLPAMAGLIGLRYPIIDLFLKRGAFTYNDVNGTTLALIGYSLGLPAYCMLRTMLSAYYSFKDTLTPVKIGFLCLILNIVFAFVLMKKYSFLGLALASSISSWLNIIILGICFRFKLPNWFKINRDLFWITIMSVAIGAGSLYSYFLIKNMSILLLPLWVFLYMFGAYALNLDAWKLIKEILKSRKK